MKLIPKLSEKRKLILLVSIILLALAIVIALYTQILRGSAKATWWDDTWAYRKALDITNSNTGDLTDFQVSFTLDTATLIADGKMQSDCDDIRITDSSGTLLNHWIAENSPGCNNSATRIWVKVPTVTQGVDATTLYLYYGNNSANNIENGNNIFEFFDDFNSPTLNNSLWSATDSYSISDGTITLTSGSLYTNSTVVPSAQNYVYEYRNKWNSSSGSYSGLQIADAQGTHSTNSGTNSLVYYMSISDSLSIRGYAADGSISSYNITETSAQYTASQGNYNVDSFALTSTSTIYSHNRSTTNTYSGTWTSAPYLWLGYFEGANSGTTSIKSMSTDWVLIRKYASSTPTVNLNNEELSPIPDDQSKPPVGYWKLDEEDDTTPYTYPTSGLVSYWTLDEESGTGEYLLDQSGNGNHATPMGTYFVGGISNGARNFPGGSTSHRVTKSSFASFPTTSISTSLWIRTKDTNSDGILAYASSSSDNDWLFYTSSNLIIFRGGSTSGTGISLNDGQWHHLVVTWQSSDGQLKVYKDGSLAHSSTLATGSSITQGGTLMLGQEQDSVGGGLSSSQSFAGNLDEVLIYNRILDSSEVESLYENSMSTVMDSSGNSNHGLLSGTSVVTDSCVSGYCRELDGILNMISIPNSTSLDVSRTDEITLEAWIYPTGDPTDDRGTIVTKINSYYMQHHIDDTITVHTFHDGGISSYFASNSTITRNQWNHVAFTEDSSGYRKIYINGKLDAEDQFEASIGSSTNPVEIGAEEFHRSFNGLIDEVKIYDYVRTADQIISDLIKGSSSVGSKAVLGNDGGVDNDIVAEHPFADNMVLYWKFEEGSGTSVTDLSGSGHNGTITEALWVEDGYYGKALSFDGSNDRVYHGSHMGLGISNVTLEAWVNIDSLSENGAIIDIGDGGDGYGVGIGGSSWDYSGNNLILLFDQVRWINTGYTLGTGWKHIVMTLNSESKPSVYVNGELVYSDTGSNPKMPENQTWIGGYYVSFRHLDAIIDEVKIYNTALNNIQVREAYKHSPIPYGSYWGQSGSTRYCVPGDSSTCNTPIGEWLFEENGGTTAYDSSGYDNTGTMANMDNSNWILGREGAALSFNGTDNYLDVGTLGNLGSSLSSSPVTLSFWFKSTYTDSISQFGTLNDGTNTALVVNFNRDQNDSYSAGRLTLNLRGDGGANLRGAANVPELYDGEWHFLSLVGDASSNSIMIYLDGSKQSVTYGAQNTISTTSNFQYPFIFGATNSRGTIQDNLECELDQIQIYNYARTPSQIAWDYNKGKPTGHWKLDECSGSTANDSSGNNYHGSISIGGSGTQTTSGFCTSDDTTEAWSNGSIGKLNSSLSFDGTDDYIEVDSQKLLDVHNSGEVTYALWYYYTGSNTSLLHRGSSYGYSGVTNCQYEPMIFPTSINLSGCSNSGLVTNMSPKSGWNFLVAVFSENQDIIKIYLNNELITSTTVSAIKSASSRSSLIFNAEPANTKMVLGARFEYSGYYQYFNGQLDDVRIYNYPLTEEQIKILHNYDSALRL